ncbi:uncharacterized protein KY384_005527 [Bacidia gigantensis]|uniref:uncharacterized protein n=1 Tax=Bacidia gigantensis TaxID=2732470 RepID=UPI001D038A6B|nr:uncharacterized protein KY384_005527 [Bacidia gigantensis]KAG8530045.1 hypothetical protein KY384_005527 [Bacidia gigantensis]
MSLADYLAKNYLTADSQPEKKSKKRKRKDGISTGLVIAEDDVSGWGNGGATRNDEEDAPLTVNNTKSAEFRRAKKSSWQTIGTPAPTNSEQAAADTILANAAHENSAQQSAEAAEENPVVANINEADVQKMESGAHAGLQSASAVTSQLAARERHERREAERAKAEMSEKAGETIYRDASGRIINVAMKRAEARKAAEKEERQKKEAEEALKGDVQKRAAQERRDKLKDAKFMPLARGEDDVEMNEEMKERQRWGDPMAGYGGGGEVAKAKSGAKGKAKGKPIYQGAAPPNRYGIRPGHRWDGVDRGNGFEKEWFKARNQQSNIRELEYQWQMDE